MVKLSTVRIVSTCIARDQLSFAATRIVAAIEMAPATSTAYIGESAITSVGIGSMSPAAIPRVNATVPSQDPKHVVRRVNSFARHQIAGNEKFSLEQAGD